LNANHYPVFRDKRKTVVTLSKIRRQLQHLCF